MRDTVELDWRVPTSEWEQFREFVQNKHGGLDGYLGYEAEAAMKEYADLDGGDEVEQIVDRLVEAAGRRPESLTGNQTDFSQTETTRVQVRVERRVKDTFRTQAEEGDDNYGVAFARALRSHREGGRYGRLKRKLNRVTDDAESLLEEMDDSERSDGLNKVDRNTLVICNRLGDQFTDDELNSEIHDIAGRGQYASDPTLEKYRDLVFERLGVEPHPHAAKTVWVPKERAAELVPDGTPRECRQPVQLLDRDDRVRRIQLTLGRRAAKRSSGRMTARTPTIRKDVLDGKVSVASTLELMEIAQMTEGFHLDRSGDSAALRVDLSVVQEMEIDLMEEIIAYRDAETDSLLGETTGTTVDQFTDGSPSPQDAGARLETLAGAVTDGGGPSREGDPDA